MRFGDVNRHVGVTKRAIGTQNEVRVHTVTNTFTHKHSSLIVQGDNSSIPKPTR